MNENTDLLLRIGRSILAGQEKRKRENKENAFRWKKFGAKMLTLRKTLKVSRDCISKVIGVSVPVIIRLEKGYPIRRRNLVEHAYQTALNYIYLDRERRAKTIIGDPFYSLSSNGKKIF